MNLNENKASRSGPPFVGGSTDRPGKGTREECSAPHPPPPRRPQYPGSVPAPPRRLCVLLHCQPRAQLGTREAPVARPRPWRANVPLPVPSAPGRLPPPSPAPQAPHPRSPGLPAPPARPRDPAFRHPPCLAQDAPAPRQRRASRGVFGKPPFYLPRKQVGQIDLLISVAEWNHRACASGSCWLRGPGFPRALCGGLVVTSHRHQIDRPTFAGRKRCGRSSAHYGMRR
ncbi:proline-rich protein HaeIII subfamily 1-like [Rattus norvegicus]|uniref:proline-rich protein HaeIII subfamily 1-like n=1 Tax=Rattus norvegicus TaxID=10116 RepID=UPI0008102758|nr:proline-rich protein HaeIII subfamily 1-like [Rattus norvegicus]|eukprot:XP_017457327.1 PREDICTED: proline-rich protein HaeIII subfamily 1-like [Rattus norvegicus]